VSIAIQKGERYWHAGRFRIDWQAHDGAVLLQTNRASFNEEPDQAAEDAAFANIASWLAVERARVLNRINRMGAGRFGERWEDEKAAVLKWIANHPAATAIQARDAYLAAYPNTPFDPVRLFQRIMDACDPAFSGWAEFRDYVVANIASVEGLD